MGLTTFIVAFFLNWAWEVAQMSAYEGFENVSLPYRLAHCLPATIMDALFIVGIYQAGRVLSRDRRWISRVTLSGYAAVILVGAIAALLTEVVALRLGWWRYGPGMPRLPFFGVGLLPVTQLSSLPVMAFLAVRWLFGRETLKP